MCGGTISEVTTNTFPVKKKHIGTIMFLSVPVWIGLVTLSMPRMNKNSKK